MPRTAVALVVAANDAGVTYTTTAVDVANGHSITAAGQKDADKVALLIDNTTVGAKNVTVKAATVDPFDQYAGAGDLIVAVPGSTKRVIALGDGARYRQADGDLYVDYEAAMTGSITPVLLP